jgi:aryl-alcohol dehydrogenase (NADP+)
MNTIGHSDLTIFPLALGGNTFGWTSDELESTSVLDAFTAQGGNFIDTADSYSAWVGGNAGGESEAIIGDWMASRTNRSELIIGTKVSQHPDFPGLSRRNIKAAADASLRRLQTDYIDLYYAHFDDEATALEETVAAFDDLVIAGKVRHIGISNYSANRVREWMRVADENGYARPVALQPHYNLVHRAAFEHGLADVAAAYGLGVIPYWSLASGFLTGKYRTQQDLVGSPREEIAGTYFSDAGLRVISTLEDIAGQRDTTIATAALAWLLTRNNVAAPIASARTVEQLPHLMAAATLRLSASDIRRLDEASTFITA